MSRSYRSYPNVALYKLILQISMINYYQKITMDIVNDNYIIIKFLLLPLFRDL